MKKNLSLILVTTALTMAAGVSAFAAVPVAGVTGLCGATVCSAAFGGDQAMPLVLVDDDGDDDDGEGWLFLGMGDDDCDDDDEDDDDGYGDDDDDDDGDDDEYGDDDDDEGCATAQGNAAPAGTVAPPANGLFGNGAPPVAVTN